MSPQDANKACDLDYAGFEQILRKLFVSFSESKVSSDFCVCACSGQANVERVPVISSLLGKKLDLMKAWALPEEGMWDSVQVGLTH